MFKLAHDPIPKTPEAAREMAAKQRLFGSTTQEADAITRQQARRLKDECAENINRAIIGELQRVGERHAPAVYFSVVEELARGVVFTSDNPLFARVTGRALIDLLGAEIDREIEDRFGT